MAEERKPAKLRLASEADRGRLEGVKLRLASEGERVADKRKVRVYNRALPLEEIIHNYQNPDHPVTEGLVGSILPEGRKRGSKKAGK